MANWKPDEDEIAVFPLIKLRTVFRSGGLTLGQTLGYACNSLCTDPHDKIFALLGISTKGNSRHITPDYTASPCSTYCAAYRAIHEYLFGGSTFMNIREFAGVGLENSLRAAVGQNRHNPFGDDDTIRDNCDGLSCGTWDLCSRIALWGG
jgi:hypothetical protein